MSNIFSFGRALPACPHRCVHNAVATGVTEDPGGTALPLHDRQTAVGATNAGLRGDKWRIRTVVGE